MKKNYFLCSLFIFLLMQSITAQTLWSDDFESYSTGNFTSQNDWDRMGGQDSWAQIVTIDANKGQSLQLSSTTNNASGMFVTHYSDWSTRDSGNDILEVSFDFYTGDSSTTGLGMVVIATENFDQIASIGTAAVDSVVFISAENIDTTLVASAAYNTWYHITITYNFQTGKLMAQADSNPVISGTITPGLVPNVFDFTAIMESHIGIDNIVFEATDQGVLGIDNFVKVTQETRLYPNPTPSSINLETTRQLEKSALFDVTGKRVKTFGSEKQLDLQNLPAGSYFLRLIYENGTRESHKIIKQ